MPSRVTVGVGDATVELRADEQTVASDEGHIRTSTQYQFDDVLQAAARVGAAVLNPDDAQFVIRKLSDLRTQLAQHPARRTEPEENDRHGR
jgi:hypothetical protein